MPTPNANESEQDYVSRCIPIVMNEGTAKDQKQAAAICHSMWKRHQEKADLTEFSMTLRSVGLNKQTGERYWKADTSDIFPDAYNDEMTLDLYRSFLDKIKMGIKPPAAYRSEAWDGGMPYVSVSHYREHSIAGDTDKVYVDGAILKATGTFRSTPLGKACFEALCDDLYTPKAEGEESPRVRVSIAFLDYKHRHKSSGFVFERSSIEDICPECARERTTERTGKVFLDGLLIHFAMTRVPVNGRTLMEVKSMTTRKEDAASIIGEELAEEIEEKEHQLVGKSEAMVIKSEDEPVVEESMDEEYRPFGGAKTMEEAKAYIAARKEEQRIGDMWYALQCVMSNIVNDGDIKERGAALSKAVNEFQAMVKDKNATIFESLTTLSFADDPVVTPDPVLERLEEIKQWMERSQAVQAPTAPEIVELAAHTDPHPLDSVISQLRADFDSLTLMNDVTAEERLRQIQGAYSAVGSEIQRLLSDVPRPEETVTAQTDRALLDAIQKLSDQVALLTSQQARPVAPRSVPIPRSVQPSAVPQQQNYTPPQRSTLRALIDKSVGLE